MCIYWDKLHILNALVFRVNRVIPEKSARKRVPWKVVLIDVHDRDRSRSHALSTLQRNCCTYVCVLSLLTVKRRMDLAGKQNFRRVSAGSAEQLKICQQPRKLLKKVSLSCCLIHGHDVP